MAEYLPDEIISEILSPALEVSEEMFSDTASTRTSPFASDSVPSSAALLVCKTWLRVATPLLYHVVVIRSTAQARALQKSLLGNPDLGRFVKMLRLEGGFGPVMEDILRKSPNVADIFLSLHIHASDSTAGLIGGLHYINPTRLILFDSEKRGQLKNKQVKDLIGALEARAPKWTNFTTIKFPYCDIPHSGREELILKLCSCPTLRTLSFPVLYQRDMAALVKISRSPSLQTIEIRRPPSRIRHLIAYIATDPRLIVLVRWLDEPEACPEINTTILPPPNPSYRPMVSAPQEVVERVWSLSLQFAMRSPYFGPDASDYKSTSPVYHDRLQFLFVSKMFHRIALPYLYRHLAFPRERPLRRLELQLASTPAVGMHIRSIGVDSHMYERNGGEPAADLNRVLCHTPHLVLLTHRKPSFGPTQPLSWTVVETLGQSAGASLQELSGFQFKPADAGSVRNSPAVFGQLTALRSLDWAVYSASMPAISFFDRAAVVPRDGLPALELLRIGSSAGIKIFTKMDLPSLIRVDFYLKGYRDSGFLRKHGPKLDQLEMLEPELQGASILALCPRISVLTCYIYPEKPNNFGCEHLAPGFQHTCLTRLILNKASLSNKFVHEKEWKEFFDKLDLAYFPVLTEIWVAAITEWPTTEHAISKSMHVGCTLASSSEGSFEDKTLKPCARVI
ncbi:hypothetical protein C8R47DRAFT_1224094 [Mycena vitilis]|nr:hypothetical protein C8R47DRAFT_1224094 [Mycena vitilis]